MQLTVNALDSIFKEIIVQFGWDEIAAIYAATFEKLHKELEMPGFRRGRVPKAIAKRQLENEVGLEVVKQVAKDRMEEILTQSQINDFLDYTITNFTCQEGAALEIKIKLEIDPQFELPKYKKGFKVTRQTYIVDPESVDEVIERIKEEHATVTQIEGPAENGNLIECDLQQLDESNLPIIGRRLTDKVIKVGEGIFGSPEAAGLVGAKTGDRVRVRIPTQDGKLSSYAIDIKRIHQQTFPVIDDAFVQATYENIKNVAELREQIQKTIEKEYEQKSEEGVRREIRKYFLENTDFIAPPSRVTRYLDYIVEEYKKTERDKPVDENEVRRAYRPLAEETVRWYLIQRKVREEEKIKVEEKEIDQRVAEIIAKYPESERGKIEAYFQDKENRLNLAWEVLEDKIYAAIKHYVKETVKTIHTSDLKTGDQA
jgi:trigger factor